MRIPSIVASPFSHLARNAPKVDDKNKDDEIDAGDEPDDAEDGETDEEKKKKSKKRKAEDQEDDEDEKKPEARAARAREKDRVKAIMSSPAGLRFPAAALQIAIGSSLPRHKAIKMLNAMTKDMSPGAGPAAADSLRDRMAAVQQPAIGAGDARPAANLAEQIVAAGRKRRGEAT